MNTTQNRSRGILGNTVKPIVYGILGLFGVVSPALGVPIGPGTAQPNIIFDGDGVRTNVTWATGVTLSPGTYDVNDFIVNTNASTGTVVPFLATYSNLPNNPTFTSVWVGPDLIGNNVGGDHTVNYPLGSQQFTLAATTDIYSGVWHDGTARVGLTLNVGTRTAHDNVFGHPGPAGSVIGGGNAFAYPDVSNVSPRTYAYKLDVASNVPIIGTPITDLYGTGVDGAGVPLADDANPDPHWQLTAGPAGTSLGAMRARTAAGGFPIPPWLGDDSKSAWIGELSANHDLTSAAGDFTTSTTFTLPADAASVRLIGRWSTDDAALQILLNGQQIVGANAGGFTVWNEFDVLSSNIIAGSTNTLEARWNNGGGPGGVRVEFDQALFQSVPEPSSLMFLGLGVLGLIGRRRRTL